MRATARVGTFVCVFSGSVTKLWRWPVKSLRGETVRSASIDERGMEGDRVLAVFDDGTGKHTWAGAHPRLLGWEAAWPAQCGCADGTGEAPVIYGPGGAAWAADDPALGAEMGADIGIEAGVSLRGGVDGTVGRILVLFEASVRRLEAEVGHAVEIERFRPNMLVESDAEPFAEQFLEPGTPIKVGEAEFTVQGQCVRCTLPSWDPLGRERDKDLQKHLITEHANIFGVYLETPRRVRVSVGDAIGAQGADALSRGSVGSGRLFSLCRRGDKSGTPSGGFVWGCGANGLSRAARRPSGG